jgi:hypothetical protein
VISLKNGLDQSIVVSSPVYVKSKTFFYLRYGPHTKTICKFYTDFDAGDHYRIADDFSSIVLESSG